LQEIRNGSYYIYPHFIHPSKLSKIYLFTISHFQD